MGRNRIAAALLASTLGISSLAAQAQAQPMRVLVIPFSALNVMESQQWISKGVQESIIADWGRGNQFSPIAYQGQLIVEDNATAARLAKQASAPLVVRGAVQVIGPNARLTAQVIDAKTGDTLNTASVTGSVTDLLKLEDELSAQLRGANASSPAAPGATPSAAGGATSYPAGTQAGASQPSSTPAGQGSNQPIMIQTPPPQIIVVGNTSPSYPNYGYDNGYSNVPGYYPYGWPGYSPWYGGTVFFTTSNSHCNNNNHCFPNNCNQNLTPGFHLAFSTGPSSGPMNIANVNDNLSMTPVATGGNLSMVPVPTGPLAPVQFPPTSSAPPRAPFGGPVATPFAAAPRPVAAAPRSVAAAPRSVSAPVATAMARPSGGKGVR